ncbi:MAG TPA: hypothetical protein VE197_02525 [Mycobacterium sp.]|nr:hypothetical protein [Mycobacterium sp.]
MTHPNRPGGDCGIAAQTALPVHAARTKVILSFIAGAYGARRIRHVIVLTPNTKPPVERGKMDVTALPHGRGTRYPHSPAYAGRHNGQSTKAQQPQRVQGVAEHLSNGARHLNARTPRGGMGYSGPVDVRQRKSMSPMTLNRPAVEVERSAAEPAGESDHRQADYFLRLLTQRRQRVEDRINKYRRAIATAEASGAVDYAGAYRRKMRIEEEDWRILEGLIDRLQQRFAVPAPGEVPALAQTAAVCGR